jgi:DNA-binding PadR family transcriptional regulator
MSRPSSLTIPDLVVLSLLAERPMHGYELTQELARREVADWAGISRPQIYYSLAKLARHRLVRPISDEDAAAGPKRRVYAPTPAARAALADALARDHWATQRPPPPFVTWLALSLHARPADARRTLRRRRRFLEEQLEKERATLKAVRADEGPLIPIAEALVRFGVAQFELELGWLAELDKLM